MLKASGALTAGAAIGGGLTISQLANVSAQDAAAPAGEIIWALDAPPPNLLPFGAISWRTGRDANSSTTR